MSGWFTFFLTTHILFVIVAFGPTFAFPLIGAMIEKNQQHALVLTEVMEAIEKRMTIPLAIGVPLLGVGLIYTGHTQLWTSTSVWLLTSIGLYTVAFSLAIFVQNPLVGRMIRIMKAAGMAGPGAPAPAPDPKDGTIADIPGIVKRARMGGMFLSVLLVTILILMVWKPGS